MGACSRGSVSERLSAPRRPLRPDGRYEWRAAAGLDAVIAERVKTALAAAARWLPRERVLRLSTDSGRSLLWMRRTALAQLTRECLASPGRVAWRGMDCEALGLPTVTGWVVWTLSRIPCGDRHLAVFR